MGIQRFKLDLPRRALSLRALLIYFLLLQLFACDRGNTPAPAPPPANAKLQLVVSADTAGWITPCGCTSNQSGGMLRRGSYLADLRKKDGSPVLYADAGGAAGGNSAYHRVKFEAILTGEQRLGVAAHNIGKSEATFGPAYLREIAARSAAPIISANVRDSAGQAVAPPAKIVSAGPRRVAFVGVLSPGFATAELKVSEPRAAILAAIAPLKGQYDSLVVLAYLPRQELESLARSLPEADAIVGGPTGQAMVPTKFGPTLLASSTNKGKFLARLTSDAAGWTGDVVEMGPTLADQPEQQQVLTAYLKDLDQRDLPASQTSLAPPTPAGAPADYRIAGSQACASCHAAEQEIWANSKHGHAWETIKAKGFHVDSACQQCHTTGFALPGGFESRKTTPALVNVGCETCHGPSQAHVISPKTARTTFAAADQCVRCHDHENSPAFKYEVYWPRVRHGKGQSPSP
jgi:mono/diheme cytochrome c family protein